MNFLVDIGGRLATRRLGREPKLGPGLRTASQEWNSRVREGRIAFTTAIGILVRSREKGLLTGSDWQNMGVIKNQSWKTPGGNWGERHDEDHEHSDGS
jgi:hypothetical protein